MTECTQCRVRVNDFIRYCPVCKTNLHRIRQKRFSAAVLFSCVIAIGVIIILMCAGIK